MIQKACFLHKSSGGGVEWGRNLVHSRPPERRLDICAVFLSRGRSSIGCLLTLKILETQPVVISSSANSSAAHLSSYKWTILGNYPEWVGGKRNWKGWLMLNTGGSKTSMLTDTHRHALPKYNPHAHTPTHWRLLNMPTPHLPPSIRTDSLKFQSSHASAHLQTAGRSHTSLRVFNHTPKEVPMQPFAKITETRSIDAMCVWACS